MPHGYCTECRAQVTVRSGRCLLDHTVDSSTIVDTPGRRLRPGSRRHPLVRRAERVERAPAPRESVAAGAIAVLEREQASETVAVPAAVTTTHRAAPPSEDALSVTGYLVEELWNLSPDEDIDGWTPTGVDETLSTTGLRTRIVAAIGVLLVIGAGVAWRALTWESAQFREVSASIETSGQRLEAALDGVGVVVDDLADGVVDEALAASTHLGRVDGEARTLFDLAGDLPDSAEGDALRDAALADASAALDLESTLSSAVAYASAVDLIARAPVLPTSVDLDGLATTTEELTGWSARFRDSVDAMPTDDLTDTHREAMVGLAASIPDWQADYLDSLRARDPERAQGLVDQLDAQLRFIRTSWAETAASIPRWAMGQIETLTG